METRTRPVVSVIVPVRDDAERLAQCLRALGSQTYPAELIDIIVVDNGSSEDPSGSLPPEVNARFFKEPQYGSYAARNRGASEARGSIFAFTDSDCLPEPGWIEAGVRVIEREPESLVAGHVAVFPRDPARPTAVEQYEMMFAFPQERYATEFGFGATANVFVSRGVFEWAGGFVETLLSGGDHEFGARLDAAGHPIVYSPEAVVRHPARRTWSELYGKIRRTTKGRVQRTGMVRRSRPRFSDLRHYLRCNARVLRSSLSLSMKARVLLVLFGVAASGPLVMLRLRLSS